jgi:hypothetical protein
MSHKFFTTQVYPQKPVEKDNYGNPKVTLSTHSEGLEEVLSGAHAWALVTSRVSAGELNWSKHMIECTVNLLTEMTQSMKPNVKEPYTNPRRGEFDIDIEMLNQLRQVSNALQYMVNSKSWADGEYYNFDMSELNRRFSRAQAQ